MKKILILGAGITGLTVGQLLNNLAQVQILEKSSHHGGIARTRDVGGIAYHVVGGHCFNSKYPVVMDFVFSKLPEKHWHRIKRVSRIVLDGYEISYPIEYAVKEIFKNDESLAFEITRDMMLANEAADVKNLGEWFESHFGKTLAKKYFIPYNAKIWGNDPYRMDYKWVEGKLPVPDKHSFFSSLVSEATDSMPHSSFYYPNTNNQNTLIDALADGLNIDYGITVKTIERIEGKWLVNDKYAADILISTIPLNELPAIIKNTPQSVLDAAGLLRYNKISNMLWRSKPTDKSWTYHPDRDTLFHRYIHIGSYFKPAEGYTITECVGEHSREEMEAAGKKDPFLIEPLDYNVSEHAYVVFDENREESVARILSYLNNIGLISIGRFGRWEYYNMDVCMKQCIDTVNDLIENWKL